MLPTPGWPLETYHVEVTFVIQTRIAQYGSYISTSHMGFGDVQFGLGDAQGSMVYRTFAEPPPLRFMNGVANPKSGLRALPGPCLGADVEFKIWHYGLITAEA